MEPRTRASLLWGLVGALSFLVLALGARLAIGVFVAATVASHLVGRHMDRKRQL